MSIASIASIDPFSTSATTSYEAYLIRQEELASTTNESNYDKLPKTPVSLVKQPATTTSNQDPFTLAAGLTNTDAGLTNTDARLTTTASGRNGAIFSALAAQFDITTQLSRSPA